MEIGRLSCQVQLKSPPTAQDAEGQPTGTWTTVATIFAEIRHLSGLQAIKAGAEASLVKASIRIRWRADVVAGMQVVWGSTTYRIEAVLPGERRRYVDLTCEVVNASS